MPQELQDELAAAYQGGEESKAQLEALKGKGLDDALLDVAIATITATQTVVGASAAAWQPPQA